ncbi:MAG TPA: CDP-diacylglycerol--serine O-phosphatidyltransferase [archaeon]|nr:CDP-diacylglycerol--serine O-phosphatidyltransferase [archaeon]
MRNPPRKKTFILPSAFTAGNILCGFFSVISAMRNDLSLACWLIVVAAFLDFIDGKVALFSHTESRFGVELDSLADIVSFGIAPGIIMFQFFLRAHGEWSWLVSFLFVLCGALRLARFNVETKGAGKTKFKGLPIPMAAAALISFVPFSRTPFFQQLLHDINYTRFLFFMILGLAGLMVSNIEYPALPRFKLLTLKGKLGLIAFLAVLFILFYYWELLLFPTAFIYIIWGIIKAILLGAAARLPEKNP